MNLRIIAALAAVTTIAFTAPAEARRHHHQQATPAASSYQMTNDGHYVWAGSDQTAYRGYAAPRHSGRRHASRTYAALPTTEADSRYPAPSYAVEPMQIDKPQEYVKPSSSTEKLVTREEHERTAGLLPSGMVRVKTVQGFYITVHPAYASNFLKFFALLKKANHEVDPRIVGCFARGGHVSGSNHYIGAACDNQRGWNRAPAYMYHVENLIRQAGLYDGCSFGDCGHVEAVRGTHNRRPNLYTSMQKFKSEQIAAEFTKYNEYQVAEVAEAPTTTTISVRRHIRHRRAHARRRAPRYAMVVAARHPRVLARRAHYASR